MLQVVKGQARHPEDSGNAATRVLVLPGLAANRPAMAGAISVSHCIYYTIFHALLSLVI